MTYRLFIDSAKPEEWDRAKARGWLYGATTNPLIIQRAGRRVDMAMAAELVEAAKKRALQEMQLQVTGHTAEEFLASGRASVVTDHIERFTATGLKLRCGAEITADVIITATGLNLRIMSGVQLAVDGQPVELSTRLAYKGMMFNDIPNLALAIGYTNASWTPKCELTAAYVCRLLRFMDRHDYSACTPRRPAQALREIPAQNRR